MRRSEVKEAISCGKCEVWVACASTRRRGAVWWRGAGVRREARASGEQRTVVGPEPWVCSARAACARPDVGPGRVGLCRCESGPDQVGSGRVGPTPASRAKSESVTSVWE